MGLLALGFQVATLGCGNPIIQRVDALSRMVSAKACLHQSCSPATSFPLIPLTIKANMNAESSRTPRKVALIVLFVVLAAPLSILLALKTEGMANQFGLTHGTPGMMIAERVVESEGFKGVAESMDVELAIDAPCWFLFLSATAMIVARRRRRNGDRS